MEFGKECWRSYEQGVSKEWLLANGIGGYASSTVIGANTRRYHGLLTASFRPPVERHLILSKIDETLQTSTGQYELYSHEAGGNIMEGFRHLQRFVLDPLPVYTFNVGDVQIEKTVCMVYGENTTVLMYRIQSGKDPCRLRLTPLVNFRDYHHTSSKGSMSFSQTQMETGVSIRPYGLETAITITSSCGSYHPVENSWFDNMNYAVERERGLDAAEDHYIPGFFEIEAGRWEEKIVTITASVDTSIPVRDGREVIEQEKKRLDKLVERADCRNDFMALLVKAADPFIVNRQSTEAKTIIAGYPWFTDWGRDTMIALTGLTLSTRRFEDAEQILYTFSRYVKYGLVPNVFPDEGQEPSYNSVDAALWYFEAVAQYVKYTGRYDFVRDKLYPSLQQIINGFREGTLFHIRQEADGLIAAGNEDTQLTWMDAKVGSWVVTPRHGKAVEINALWYNALVVMSRLAERFDGGGADYAEIAERVRSRFTECFWNEEKQCLYDVVRGDFRDGKIRPNQIFAVSLSHPVLTGVQARKVVETVWNKLYTSYGLRSLAREDSDYRGTYRGDTLARDGAYHQGTVWAWLIGPFITAFSRVFRGEPRFDETLAQFFLPLKDHLRDACLGNISEIFDGEEPLAPRGCFAQAWSVGEVLRAFVDEGQNHTGSIYSI